MAPAVMAAVLFSAVLHAAWNTLIKASEDKQAGATMVCVAGGALSAAALPFLPPPLPASWTWIGASVVLHVVYFSLVARAYRYGDLSYVYPLMRGSAPLIVALATAVLLGERLSAGEWLAAGTLCAGVLTLALEAHAARPRHGAATVFAIANALVIVTYTVVDGIGARASGHAAAYTLWMFLLTAAPLVAMALWRNPAALRGRAVRGWLLALVGGACTVGAYTIVLWAMTRAPIVLVAALRETSVLFGTLLGGLVLRERLGGVRSLAVGLIAAGAIALKLL